MRKYLTPKDVAAIKNIISTSKKQHLEKFAVEEYCKENGIDFDRVSPEIDSYRYLQKSSGCLKAF